jgi:hypothetical protein
MKGHDQAYTIGSGTPNLHQRDDEKSLLSKIITSVNMHQV